MELYGLKDKDGKEYKVTLPDTTVPNAIDNRTFTLGDLSIKPVEPKKEFKTGDWVFEIDRKFINTRHRVTRIIKIENNEIWCEDFNESSWLNSTSFIKAYRHATPQEIETHLRKICDEKYIGKKVKSLFSDTIDTIQVYQSFSFSRDQMWYTGNTMGVLVYEQGKFADIVPGKKKLPKTKEEFKVFLKEYSNQNVSLGVQLLHFLSDYEDT